MQYTHTGNTPEGRGHFLALATVGVGARHMVLQRLLAAPGARGCECMTSVCRKHRALPLFL